MKNVIAIDGPAASGKGTLAKQLAAELNYALLDTGKLYRAVGKLTLAMVVDARTALADQNFSVLAKKAALSLEGEITKNKDFLNDPSLLSEEVASVASKVAVIPEVREALFNFQRSFAQNPPNGMAGAILDGRDIGTVICPDAPIKFFVTASPEVRAKRRFDELVTHNSSITYAQILKDVLMRDERDQNRKDAPLIAAEDSMVIDSSDLSATDVFRLAMDGILSIRT